MFLKLLGPCCQIMSCSDWEIEELEEVLIVLRSKCGLEALDFGFCSFCR